MMSSRIVPSQAYEIIKHFEGLRITSYKCPAGVWTIGWGTTGNWLKSGITITQQQADLYLQEAIVDILQKIPDEIYNKLNDHQIAALLSFLYNVGLGALDAPSFGRAIRSNLDSVSERFLDWDKAIVDGVKKPLPGLTRRRRAESILWRTGQIELRESVLDNFENIKTIPLASNQLISLVNVAKHYKALPHQINALEWLESRLSDNIRSEFASLYRALPEAAKQETLKPCPRLVFDMPLNDKPTRNIIIGVLRLTGWKTEHEWQCTSGQPGHQYSGGTKLKGKGALPGHRYVKTPDGNNIESYQVNLLPYNLKHVKGIEGNAFHILPDPIYISGVLRSELMIHNDSNRLYSPGSAGCIVTMTTKEFNQIEQLFKELRQVGYKQIPLEVNH